MWGVLVILPHLLESCNSATAEQAREEKQNSSSYGHILPTWHPLVPPAAPSKSTTWFHGALHTEMHQPKHKMTQLLTLRRCWTLLKEHLMGRHKKDPCFIRSTEFPYQLSSEKITRLLDPFAQKKNLNSSADQITSSVFHGAWNAAAGSNGKLQIQFTWRKRSDSLTVYSLEKPKDTKCSWLEN